MYVYVHILSGVDGVGEMKDRVSCDFTARSFDLKVIDYNGQNLRLYKNNLFAAIVPEESKVVVKKNSLKIKLRKVKVADREYCMQWMYLTTSRPMDEDEEGKPKVDPTNPDPGKGIEDVLRNLYETGDAQTRKNIGEAMVKTQQKIKEKTLHGFTKEIAGMSDRDERMPGGALDIGKISRNSGSLFKSLSGMAHESTENPSFME